MFNHTGGTAQWYDGLFENCFFGIESLYIFLTLTEFQSWKVNFSTVVCLRTADPQITMHWIEEVGIAKSIDELMTSRPIVGRTDVPDFDLLDAMIASALKKHLSTHIHFRKRVSVEEQ